MNSNNVEKISFGKRERQAAQRLIELGLAEDLADRGDITCEALLSEQVEASVQIVARQPGVVCGLPIIEMVYQTLSANVECELVCDDGIAVQAGDVLANLSGDWPALLTGERTVLNFLTHLSGVATATAEYVQRVAGTKAVILDTRKTLPGYRRLQKYAVRAGGGSNHRMGLYDECMIKDNHLAAVAKNEATGVAAAIKKARAHLGNETVIEVEVDRIDQLKEALSTDVNIVLLDNMSTDLLREAVELRDQTAPQVLLEASGGVNLETVQAISQTGVDRISIGALTHSVIALDLGYDWDMS